MDNPSVSEANKVLRVLKGTSQRLKYTVCVNQPDGKVVEFQSDNAVTLKWDDATRSVWIHSGDYGGHPVMEFVPGSMILTEENPKP